jgi:hypothetical protein
LHSIDLRGRMLGPIHTIKTFLFTPHTNLFQWTYKII